MVHIHGVILSGVAASLREAATESKDPDKNHDRVVEEWSALMMTDVSSLSSLPSESVIPTPVRLRNKFLLSLP